MYLIDYVRNKDKLIVTFINMREKCQWLSLDIAQILFLETGACRLFGP